MRVYIEMIVVVASHMAGALARSVALVWLGCLRWLFLGLNFLLHSLDLELQDLLVYIGLRIILFGSETLSAIF